MDVFVHDEPRAELQAGSRSHLRPSKLKFDLAFINGLDIDVDDDRLGNAQSNRSGQMPCQVLVRQYPRGLRIAFKLDYVLMPVIRSHQLSLRAAAEATNMLNCLDVHCDVPLRL